MLGILSNILIDQRFPKSWKRCMLVLIPKGVIGKYRAICLLDAVEKIFRDNDKVQAGRVIRRPVKNSQGKSFNKFSRCEEHQDHQRREAGPDGHCGREERKRRMGRT